MSNYQTGHDAEARVADWLRERGFRIMTINWKTPVCEIDIIAIKSNIIFFIEVKYRQSDLHGSGVEYVTSKKLKRMSFAAELWVQQQGWDGDYQLAVVQASPGSFTLITDVM